MRLMLIGIMSLSRHHNELNSSYITYCIISANSFCTQGTYFLLLRATE